MQCVLDALRSQPGFRVIEAAEWNLAITLAEEQGVLPLFAQKLLGSTTVLPPEIHTRMIAAKREALHYSFLQTSDLKELLRAFAAAEIPVIPLKGPWLAQRLYGDASLRISCDLDLLVQQQHFATASLLLHELNFAPQSIPDGYHQKWARATTILELHFDVENPLAIDFNVEDAWKRARQLSFNGQPAWQLTPQDEFLYVCLHGVRHRFDRLSLIVDIALARKQLVSDADLELLLARESEPTTPIVLLGCALADTLYPTGACPSLTARHGNTGKVQGLAGRLWNDLMTTPPAQQDWASLHRFYLELEPTPAKRIRRRFLHLRILLTRIIDEDLHLAARLGLQRRWQVWLVRHARLALQHRRFWSGSRRT